MADDDFPSLSRPPREEDPEIKLRDEIISRGRKLNEALAEQDKAELAVRSAQTALDSAERDVAVRRSNWDDALTAYENHKKLHG